MFNYSYENPDHCLLRRQNSLFDDDELMSPRDDIIYDQPATGQSFKIHIQFGADDNLDDLEEFLMNPTQNYEVPLI